MPDRAPAPPSSPPTPRPRPRRRYHVRSPAMVYLFVTMLVALGAFNSQNNLLFWAFGFALAMVIVSGFLSGAMLMGLEVTREPIADSTCGSPAIVKYRVRNRNHFMPAFGLTLEEIPPRPRSLLDRHPDSNWPAFFGPPRAFVVHVGPRETLVCEASVPALQRGKASFSAVRVRTSFPFGLIVKSLEFRQPQTALIRPEMFALKPDLLSPKDRAGESGSPSRRMGQGEEFFSLREYVEGDNPRSIAWRPSARHIAAGGKLLVRQNAAPAPIRLWIVLRLRLGAPATPTVPDPDESAISLAASLARQAHELGLDVGLAIPLASVEFPPRHSHRHFDRLLNELALLELGASDGRGIRDGFPAPASSRGSICVVVHAGPIDRTFAPDVQRTIHLSSLDTIQLMPSAAPTAPRGTTPNGKATPAPAESAA